MHLRALLFVCFSFFLFQQEVFQAIGPMVREQYIIAAMVCEQGRAGLRSAQVLQAKPAQVPAPAKVPPPAGVFCFD
jgi:hypothetical protein